MKAPACDCCEIEPALAAAWVDFSLALLNMNSCTFRERTKTNGRGRNR